MLCWLCWLGFFFFFLGWFLSSLCVHSQYEDAAKKKKKRQANKKTPSEKNTHTHTQEEEEEEEEEDARAHGERERLSCSLRTQRLQNNNTKPPKKIPTKIQIYFFKKREWKWVCTYVANWEPLRALSCAAPLVGWIRKMPKNTQKKHLGHPPPPPPKTILLSWLWWLAPGHSLALS
jgi:hypothetical protein